MSVTLTLLRSAMGWTQKELAGATGIPSSVLSDYEKGRRTLPRERLDVVAKALGVGFEAVDLSLYCLGFIQPREKTPGFPLELSRAELQLARRASATAARLAGEEAQNRMIRSLQARKIGKARKKAEDLWERLKQFSPRERRMLVEGTRAFRSWALCERLCAESERAAAADAGRALDLADLALRVATRVPGAEDWRSQVQGYAWAFMGNARRVANDLPGAEEAFVRSWELWNQGSVGGAEILAEWRLLDLHASLRRGQRKLSEALVLLDRALEISSSREDARILLKKAFTLEQMGEYERAIAVLKQAVPSVDRQRDPRLLFALWFNLAVNLCYLERHEESAMLIPGVRSLAIELGNSLDLVRVLWLDGRLAAALGRRQEAVAALEQVRTEFIARGLAYDAALVSLELAVVYLEEGRTSEVQAMVRQMAPVFNAQGVHREALAALRLFSEAVERETITVDLARRLAEYLKKARHEPELPFHVNEGQGPEDPGHLIGGRS